MISGRFLLLLGLLAGALAPGCSAGESGLVLGRPLPALSGASGESDGIDALAGASGSALVESGGVASGGSALAGADGADASAGAPAAGGDAGAGGSGDPEWLDALCTPVVSFEDRAPADQAQIFADAVPEPSSLVQEAAHAACRTLFRDASEVKAVAGISLVLEDFAGAVETGGTSIRISSSHLKGESDAARSVLAETSGMLHFATSLVYQNDAAGPVWLITGIADFVRLGAGLIDRGARTKGGTYEEGYRTTAFFLEYLCSRNPDIVYRLNQRLASDQPAWSDDAFVTLMGVDLATLWTDYQASLP